MGRRGEAGQYISQVQSPGSFVKGHACDWQALRRHVLMPAILLASSASRHKEEPGVSNSFSVVDNVRQASGGASSARGRGCGATRVLMRLRLYLFVRDSVGVVLTLCGQLDSSARSTPRLLCRSS